MRRVVLYQLLSLDGVAEEPGDWMFDSGSEVFANLSRVISTQDTVLLGRHTHDYWSGFWPEDGPEPFRTFINQTPKHVFASRPLERNWANTIAVSGDARKHVQELRATSGADIGIHGSVELARSLLHAGLVDELQLVVAGTIAGQGRRLFDGVESPRALTLENADRTKAGTLLLSYRAGS